MKWLKNIEMKYNIDYNRRGMSIQVFRRLLDYRVFLMIIWLTSISSFEYSVSEPKVVDDFQKQIFMVLNVRMEYLNSEQKTFILHGRSVNKFWEDQR